MLKQPPVKHHPSTITLRFQCTHPDNLRSVYFACYFVTNYSCDLCRPTCINKCYHFFLITSNFQFLKVHKPKKSIMEPPKYEDESEESIYYEELKGSEKFKKCCAESYHPYKKVNNYYRTCWLSFTDSTAKMDSIISTELHLTRRRSRIDYCVYVDPSMLSILRSRRT